MEVLAGIHQLKLPVPVPTAELTEVNSYLIEGQDDFLLVDTGWDTQQTLQALESQLADVGVGFEDIRQIIVTHFHPDHYGLAGKLKQRSGATVALHRVEQEFVHSRYVDMDGLLAETADLLRLHGVPQHELPRLQKASLGVRKYVLPVLPDIALCGGEKVTHGRFDFEVVWTPGHSPGHVCLYEAKRRVLISGDHVLPTIFPNVSLHPQSGDNPLGDYLRSLRVVEQLDVDLVLPAHEHVFAGLRQRVSELYRHHEDRREAIVNVLKEGAKTAYEVSLRIPWIVNGVAMSFEELSALDRRLAVMSALAHLEPLCAEGRAERLRRDGTIVYGAAGAG